MDERLLRAYERLLAAYPTAFRNEYGADMVQLLGDQLRDRPVREQRAVFVRAVADLVRTAPSEHLSAVRSRPLAATAGGATLSPPVQRRRERSPSRRDFLRASLAFAGAGVSAGLGGASLAFLWPNVRGEFGALVDIGSVAEVAEGVRASGGTFAVPVARSYLVAYDPADDPDGMYTDVTGGAMFMALYQRCVHLGCRVPWCVSSTRFECPCHKSRYNRWGEYQDGPAPRGLDRFAVSVVDGHVIVDTRVIVTGPPRMGAVLNEGPTGASCL